VFKVTERPFVWSKEFAVYFSPQSEPNYIVPTDAHSNDSLAEHMAKFARGRTTIFLPLKRAVKGGKSTFAALPSSCPSSGR
jgi:hypothetical protein